MEAKELLQGRIKETIYKTSLRVAPINPAVLGCEKLAPASSVIER